MSKKSEARRLEAVDPTLPSTTITLDGKEYRLCFDLGALAEAETAINREIFASKTGAPPVNLMVAFPLQNLASTRIMFAAAVRRFHPAMTFAEALGLLTPLNVLVVAAAVREAWEASLPAKEDVDPTQAGEEQPDSL